LGRSTKELIYGELMFQTTFSVSTQGEGDIIDITSHVKKAVRESTIQQGVIHLFVQHSTAALTTIEFEPGVLEDLKRALSVRITPAGGTKTGVHTSRRHLLVRLLLFLLMRAPLNAGHGSRLFFLSWM
jgi:thiamine phosphate synthase YjbQ (UPF0047 family)